MKFSIKTYRLIFWFLILGLIVASSIPNGTLNRTIHADQFEFRLDYLLHFIAYLVIGISASLAYKPNWKVIFLLFLFAVVEEGHQYWIPSRSMNPVDFMYDMIGLFSGIGLIFFGKRFIH